MGEFLSKFQGRRIKIDRVNSIRVATSMIFFDILGCHCIASDVIMSYRFLCVELASTSVSLYTLIIIAGLCMWCPECYLRVIRCRQEEVGRLTANVNGQQLTFIQYQIIQYIYATSNAQMHINRSINESIKSLELSTIRDETIII